MCHRTRNPATNVIRQEIRRGGGNMPGPEGLDHHASAAQPVNLASGLGYRTMYCLLLGHGRNVVLPRN